MTDVKAQQNEMRPVRPASRPAALTGAGVLLILLALGTGLIRPALLIMLTGFCYHEGAPVLLDPQILINIAWICGAISALVYLAFAIGLWRLRGWAYRSARMALLCCLFPSLIMEIGLLFTLPGDISIGSKLLIVFVCSTLDLLPVMMLSGVVFYLLRRANVAAAFGDPHGTGTLTKEATSTPASQLRDGRDLPVAVIIIAACCLLLAAGLLGFGILLLAYQAAFDLLTGLAGAFCVLVALIFAGTGTGLLRLAPEAQRRAIILAILVIIPLLILAFWEYAADAWLAESGVILAIALNAAGIFLLTRSDIVEVFE